MFDPATGTQTGLVSIPGANQTLDTVIDPAGQFAYVSDFSPQRIWVVDLATQALASGTNPIVIGFFAEDLDITSDGQYLLVTDGGSGNAISSISTTTRTVVNTFNVGTTANAVTTRGSDVLVGDFNGAIVRRLSINGSGVLSNTGQASGAGTGGFNTTISPSGATALVHEPSGTVTSILVSGMSTVNSAAPGDTIVATAFRPDGNAFYLRTGGGGLAGYNYNPATGIIGTQMFNIGGLSGASTFFGVDQLDATATRVYTQNGAQVSAFDGTTGAALGSMPVAGAGFIGVDVISGGCTGTPVTIDFESLMHADNLNTTHAQPYIEDGFVLEGLAASPLRSFGTLESRFTGSTALFNDANNGVTRLTKSGGGTFTLTSINLAELNGNNVATVTFTGTKPDTSTVTQAFTIDGVAFGQQTFTFPATFTNLTKVEWAQVALYHQYDNIVVAGCGGPPPNTPPSLTAPNGR